MNDIEMHLSLDELVRQDKKLGRISRPIPNLRGRGRILNLTQQRPTYLEGITLQNQPLTRFGRNSKGRFNPRGRYPTFDVRPPL